MTTPMYPLQPGTQTSQMGNGTKAVAVAGTAEPLVASSLFIHEGNIQANPSNTGNIYVGGPGVNSTNGYFITAGQNFPLTAMDLQNVYIDCSINGEGVRFVYRR